ncbi:MAG: site-specific DNA-methyltransferase [Chloroflexi bacterium]|nr:site-specific DNA-methyltransferase [Chloroflexota bacterium]
MKTQLFHGDCLEILKNFDPESIDLIYLDPPFFTQKKHSLQTRDRKQKFSFDDLWPSHTEYTKFIYNRLEQMWKVLSPKGAVFFHCDRNASHIIRALLDEIFGPTMFRSEIIWSYRRWSNSQNGLLPGHQNIFYYTKSKIFTFNKIFREYSESTNVDQILQRRKRDVAGKAVYETDDKGQVIPSGGKKGVPLRDVWNIPYLNPKAKERTGYPTQKPLLLLERIIKIASKEGDIVLDPFCGSGTTLVAAMLMNRQAIGIDISEDALEITQKRLNKPTKTESRLIQRGRDAYKNADEESLHLLRGMKYAPVQRNKGIDAILSSDVHGKPILVRIQRSNETILDAAQYLYRASQGKNAGAMFVIAIKKGGYIEFEDQFPPNIKVINAPAIEISEVLDQLINSSNSV